MEKALRNLLPYLKDWEAWQREVKRLERNIVKLRQHRFTKLARTLEESLPQLRLALEQEKREHAFTINRLIRTIERRDRRGAKK